MTITERLRNGSLECLGKVGLAQPPHIVAPLTVEPTKPRLCVNLMYLNNWIKSVPFNLDTLKDIPRIVKTDAYFTSIDDKSGFDNVRLSEESFNLVGFQWGGYYYWYKTLPFGFKLSSYIYHTLNMQPTSYIRKHFSIPIFLYIDDRLVEEFRSEGIEPSDLLANYIVCEILNRLGYCLNLTKTIFVPTQSPVVLGFKVDSVERCFRLTESKKKKFVGFREACLAKSELSILDLQKLSGRCISFILAVPAAKLYTREMNSAIFFGINSKSGITLNGGLKDEITSWRFWMNGKGFNIASILRPYMLCKGCATANDVDYIFCKICGSSRNKSLECVDECSKERDQLLHKIEKRIDKLDNLLKSGIYSKQKCSLKTELENFFFSLEPLKNLSNAVPEDIREFVVFKEKNGRTQLHEDNCVYCTEHGLKNCSCP
ncbi:unnamed protein product [Mytilus coruscus]|uniref:Reverse transcriptase domain-containing protein n=1 Tax=Mytilus coruscus TaxID=42192 RepID=A0A6J8E3Y3_MYTCO|nr:unnamed protein product [Mytilus coruscus]